jgi:hypothetical protein
MTSAFSEIETLHGRLELTKCELSLLFLLCLNKLMFYTQNGYLHPPLPLPDTLKTSIIVTRYANN